MSASATGAPRIEIPSTCCSAHPTKHATTTATIADLVRILVLHEHTKQRLRKQPHVARSCLRSVQHPTPRHSPHPPTRMHTPAPHHPPYRSSVHNVMINTLHSQPPSTRTTDQISCILPPTPSTHTYTHHTHLLDTHIIVYNPIHNSPPPFLTGTPRRAETFFPSFSRMQARAW